MKRLLDVVLAQRTAVYALVAALVVAGLIAVGGLPESVYPELDLSRINVRAELGNLAPSLVQSALARPLEAELAAEPGVAAVSATSTEGAADITVTFDPRVAATGVALQRVATAVGAVQSTLPKATTVRIEQIGANLFPVLSYALTSTSLSQAQLREAALYAIRPQLTGLPGLALVTVLGGDVREYLVSVDPLRLAAAGLSLEQLTATIARTNTIDAVGHADSGYVRSTILATGLAHSPQELANIPLGSKGGVVLTVGSIATVLEATAPPSVRAATRGRPAVIVNVFAQPHASFVAAARIANAAMKHALDGLPQIEANRFLDQSILVSAAIDNLRDAILIGLVLSGLVLLFFLRDLRLTLIAGSIIPITVVITFAVMRFLGQGLSLMTLGGLAVGVGLIIDDAIVVVENIARHIGSGGERRRAVITAVSEIAGPMTSSTVTTIVVFAPLSILSGIPGAFFTALSTSLTVAVLISLVLAFVFTPNVALATMRRAGEGSRNALVDWLDRRYIPLLDAALHRRWIVAGAGIAVLLLTIVLGRQLGTDFLPSLDEGAFELTYALPPGTALPETERVAREMQAVVDADPAVARSAGIIGASMTLINTDTPQGTSGGTMRATLHARRSIIPLRGTGDDGRTVAIGEVMERIGNRIRAIAPNVQFTMRQLLQDSLNDLANEQAPIELRLFGPQQSILIPLANAVTDRLTQIDGVAGASSGVVFHNPSIVMRAEPAASTFGVSAAQLNDDARALFGGDVVATIVANPLTIPVRVRYAGPLDPIPTQLRDLPYVTPGGGVVPLSRLATFTAAPPQSDIHELNGRQYLAITAQISGSNLGAIADGIRAQMRGVALPPGYSYEIAGAYALARQSFAEFALVIALSVGLVLIVMIVQFRSAIAPLAILTAVPLAAFGAVVALRVMHISLNVSSLMGMILLVGLVVKNGILLLEYAAGHRRSGESIERALVSAGRVRLRPIVMTTLTALLGMLPLALAIGSGSELLQPLAVAVIGGLAFSLPITLVVVPVVFALLSDGRRRVAGAQTAAADGGAPATARARR